MSEKYTPGPWNACNNGECQCKLVRYQDGPVAEVISGEWGDEFPNIRLVKNEHGPGEHAGAFVEMTVYGEVSEQTATANARLIAAAPDLLHALLFALPELEADARHSPGMQGMVDVARAALAKARGEAT